jgi:signal peptidase I
MAEQTTVEPAPTRSRRIFEEIKGLLVTGGLMLFAGTAIGQPFIVPSGSMEPTLMIGDEIAAAKYAYGYGPYSAPIGVIPINGRLLDSPPERGDIVVFALPRDPKQTYVKRLIGLIINGQEVERRPAGRVTVAVGSEQVSATKYVETLPNGRTHDIIKVANGRLDDTEVYTVPAGHYFMMGDNRDNSLDSRVSPDDGGVGYVPAENLIGRVSRVLFSITPNASWLDAITDPRDLRVSRLFHPVR